MQNVKHLGGLLINVCQLLHSWPDLTWICDLFIWQWASSSVVSVICLLITVCLSVYLCMLVFISCFQLSSVITCLVVYITSSQMIYASILSSLSSMIYSQQQSTDSSLCGCVPPRVFLPLGWVLRCWTETWLSHFPEVFPCQLMVTRLCCCYCYCCNWYFL